jgi:Alanine dehydrogenase
MNAQITSLGVIQESRDDESRVPLAPVHIKKIKEKYPSINIIVQPSKLRAFNESEYIENGAEISDNLQDCNVIFGVKEVDDKILIPEKTYIFFSLHL